MFIVEQQTGCHRIGIGRIQRIESNAARKLLLGLCLRVRLFANGNVEDTVLRSKAVGEPPLLLAFSVFFAIRDAIASVGGHRANPPLDAPATGEAILGAIAAVREADAEPPPR